MADGTPKLSKEVLLQVRYEYEAGKCKSLSELAQNYGISVQALHARVKREKWDVKRQNLLEKADKSFEDTVLKQTKSWVDKVKNRAEVDWNIIDRSIDNVGSEVDPDMMLTSIRAKKLLDDMFRRSAGLVDPNQQLDITSKGQSIGESLVSAIAKLRADKSLPVITDADADRILECEIVDDNSDKLKS